MNKKIIELCHHCGCGVTVPENRREYTAYCFQHVLGMTLCEVCYNKWLDDGRPYPEEDENIISRGLI